MEKKDERKELLRRLFHNKDRDLYNLGKLAGILWFEKFQDKFERYRYAYFADEERREAIERIISELSDEEFVRVVNQVYRMEDRYLEIDRFVGEHYYFDPDVGVLLENRQSEVETDVWRALEETKGRCYYFLKAIIELYKIGKEDKAYGGVRWQDILAEIRRLKGEYPPPRDLALLKSYKIYYKTGRRRYPTHSVPREIFSVVEKVLKEYELKKGRKYAF